MEDYPHLSNAPSVEAIFDIRARFPKPVTLEVLAGMQPPIEDDYPTLTKLNKVSGRVHIRPGEPVVTEEDERRTVGYRIRSVDEKNVAQLRVDGFTFSRLEPYQGWQAFFSEAWGLWEAYAQATGPIAVTRLAIRFVNRIQLPPTIELSDYFYSHPNLPPDVPQQMTAFLYRYVLKPEAGIGSRVTLASESQTSDVDQTSIVFDIDCGASVDLLAKDTSTIRATFDQLRDMKNRIFFSSLTPLTLGRFK